ncbi:hypothetical protein [uncultured Arcticibacterium sp.]|uniref:hypothetical protein n=1 Tax=uncultured Arcticibacterium sp. TaxID=2173042 RepID=UPI0030F634ED
MKKVLVLILVSLVFTACKDKEDDPSSAKTTTELISLNQWELSRFTNVSGQTISNSDLETQAFFLFAMNFEFRSDNEVRGIDKTSGNIISKGVWDFVGGEEVVNVKLSDLDYDFKIVVLQTGKLTLQAPTGNFLSGVGEEINLEFNAVSQ